MSYVNWLPLKNGGPKEKVLRGRVPIIVSMHAMFIAPRVKKKNGTPYNKATRMEAL